LGLAKIGVIPALINFNLRQQALIHTIKVADCKGAIYGLEIESGCHKSCFLYYLKVI
jgi:solute carrier family 27 fatty acid transporter 1/4